MKNINTKITLSVVILSVTLLQGCVATTLQTVVPAIIGDVSADAIRTSFSKEDFGLIDDGLKNKQSVYIGFDTLIGEVNAKEVCDSFRERNDKYNCQIVALTKDANEYKKLSYSKPSADGIYLKITKLDFGVFTGTTYQLTYQNMLSGKIAKFSTPGFFKRSQIIKYVGEYLMRLVKKADDKVK
ncbi:hypothetical protein [Bathymodiolus thermophilus thioautotrophic gill symbiont]|uniref:Lipoprotein n=1 Tax=Bathymodiolus thermophilus thioautotrophic gill symbiont TaxID=2360 RepID=A0A1J5TZH3_9GAMM|nr:hypothetical protein [Bathymodiolus thermophilus thioautotrophic gill symbiont]OIR25636.1 hypothetical protein BGC33_13755 [Bathymodiolus thermophilus thioautotrophic gill symbiont]